MLDPFPIEDLIPEDKEVDGAVCHLHLNRAGSPSVIKVEDIWDCLRKATRYESPDPLKWEMVICLIQAYFCERKPCGGVRLIDRRPDNKGV